MKAKSEQEVRGEQRKCVILWCVVLFIIIAAIVYFARIHPAQAIEAVEGGWACWTYPTVQDFYAEPLLDRQQFFIENHGFDGCHQRYSFPIMNETCCKAGASIVPVAFESDGSSTGTRVWWFCSEKDLVSGPANGQLIFFDTDVYVGFLPDPTCYEP